MMSLASPKSQIFTIFPCARRTLRAARSRWTHYMGRKETTSEWLQLRPGGSTPARPASLWGHLKGVPEKGRHPVTSHSQPIWGSNRGRVELRSHCYSGSKIFLPALLSVPLPLKLRLGLKRSLCLELTFFEAKNSIPRATW